MTFARKINKIPEFYMIFARIVPEFYIIIVRKYFSRIWGARPPAPRLLCLCLTPLPQRTIEVLAHSL